MSSSKLRTKINTYILYLTTLIKYSISGQVVTAPKPSSFKLPKHMKIMKGDIGVKS